jgi:hypothetical protein
MKKIQQVIPAQNYWAICFDGNSCKVHRVAALALTEAGELVAMVNDGGKGFMPTMELEHYHSLLEAATREEAENSARYKTGLWERSLHVPEPGVFVYHD